MKQQAQSCNRVATVTADTKPANIYRSCFLDFSFPSSKRESPTNQQQSETVSQREGGEQKDRKRSAETAADVAEAGEGDQESMATIGSP